MSIKTASSQQNKHTFVKMFLGCVRYQLRTTGSAGVACRLSRTVAHGILVPQSETEPESPALESKFSTPRPVFLPGESQGRRSLVGCRLWGRTESDTTEAT